MLSNTDILNYIKNKRLVIEPFEEEILRENGLDLRLGNTVARLKESWDSPICFDSKGKNDLQKWFKIEKVKSSFIVNRKERLLCHTIEYVKLPNDLIGICELRSTFARMGLSIPPTIIDAGFEGQLTLELIGSNFPIKLYNRQRFLHVIFSELRTPAISYKGKYQGQKGLTLPRFDKGSG